MPDFSRRDIGLQLLGLGALAAVAAPGGARAAAPASAAASSAAPSLPDEPLLPRMKWLNAPPESRIEGDALTVTSSPKADFYRMAGWATDNGNFLHLPVEGDFSFEARTTGDYRAKYDQSGLMMRLDAQHWVKCGNEFVDGQLFASAVITREFSDWSTSKALSATAPIWWRLVRWHESVKVSCSLDGQDFVMVREGYFPASAAVDVGVMCASLEGPGVRARFDALKLARI
jgi:regulation of enolase protein 1 (concanavalin A-like superfamily)